MTKAICANCYKAQISFTPSNHCHYLLIHQMPCRSLTFHPHLLTRPPLSSSVFKLFYQPIQLCASINFNYVSLLLISAHRRPSHTKTKYRLCTYTNKGKVNHVLEQTHLGLNVSFHLFLFLPCLYKG